ncbi:hypothetical protein PG1C_03080 [Rugosibacter aromaticivorans]|uniref:Uncharacterized protein n=1 Tax=Rugosibacter aromaticivorans TaxID=1565605 RepID=A0A0C5J7M3_9PROT|nr:hypothetical protein [Rugosibacter aromaticivorans]AJP47718.1 hypothetical protein PG1C_03080 [Rugosibacter aromaticivorans]
MVEHNKNTIDRPGKLLVVIKNQTEISKRGLDPGGIITLAAERARALTESNGTVVELIEGEGMVYGGAAVSATTQILYRHGRVEDDQRPAWASSWRRGAESACAAREGRNP